jgi:hypothetical protein
MTAIGEGSSTYLGCCSYTNRITIKEGRICCEPIICLFITEPSLLTIDIPMKYINIYKYIAVKDNKI